MFSVIKVGAFFCFILVLAALVSMLVSSSVTNVSLSVIIPAACFVSFVSFLFPIRSYKAIFAYRPFLLRLVVPIAISLILYAAYVLAFIDAVMLVSFIFAMTVALMSGLVSVLKAVTNRYRFPDRTKKVQGEYQAVSGVGDVWTGLLGTTSAMITQSTDSAVLSTSNWSVAESGLPTYPRETYPGESVDEWFEKLDKEDFQMRLDEYFDEVLNR